MNNNIKADRICFFVRTLPEHTVTAHKSEGVDCHGGVSYTSKVSIVGKKKIKSAVRFYC